LLVKFIALLDIEFANHKTWQHLSALTVTACMLWSKSMDWGGMPADEFHES
jgi:hypothetical protein